MAADNQEPDSALAPFKPMPRAMVPVNVSEEAVYWAIFGAKANGVHAFGVLMALNIQAKKQKDGLFKEPLGVLADRIGVAARDIQQCAEIVQNACAVCKVEPWLTIDENGLELRIFKEWNRGWGGRRSGSGRPQVVTATELAQLELDSMNKSSANQEVIKTNLDSNLNIIKTKSSGNQERHPESESDPIPSTSSESEPEAHTAQVTESEGAGARLGGTSESGSGIQIRGLSDSGSPERRKGLVKWATATVPMIGLFKTDDGFDRYHGKDSPQGLADRTSIRSLFEGCVWPADLPDDEGIDRLDTGLQFVALAKKNGKVPMAYLTNLCKKHINEPTVVFG